MKAAQRRLLKNIIFRRMFGVTNAGVAVCSHIGIQILSKR